MTEKSKKNSVVDLLDSNERILVVPCNKFTIFVHKVMMRVERKYQSLRKQIDGNFHTLTKTFISSDVGFDKKLNPNYQYRFLQGYFQSYKYLDNNSELSISKLLSKWLHKSSRNLFPVEIDFKTTVGLHVRRGDYLEELNSYFGTLSVDYYLNALNIITGAHKIETIIIFSDSDVENEFKVLERLGMKVIYISSNYPSSAIDEMRMMSALKFLIIGNSTFSWWAAYLGDQNSVFAPSKWFIARKDPTALVPPHWTTVTSDWNPTPYRNIGVN